MRTLALAAFAMVALIAAKPAGSLFGVTPVTPLAKAEVRTAASGKASIRFLALGENAFIGRLELAPGAKVPQHRDATEEYLHILEGSGVITIDGQAYDVGPGATVYMPANAEVSYQNGPATLVAIQVFAGPAPAKKYDAWKAPK